MVNAERCTTFYKGLLFGPGNKWPDLAAHLSALFGIFLIAAGSYVTFWLKQPPDWTGMSLYIGGIGTIMAGRVAKDHFRAKDREAAGQPPEPEETEDQEGRQI
jgi:hypothetical protein